MSVKKAKKQSLYSNQNLWRGAFVSYAGNMKKRTMADFNYTPSHVANFILDRASKEGIGISPIHLQKLVYISYGWVRALLDRRLFDEPFEAWKKGPVCASLYHEFKHYGIDYITKKSCLVDSSDEEVFSPEIDSNDFDTLVVLGMVWDIYKQFNPWQLVDKTHEKGTPWDDVYRSDERYTQLKDESIKAHFRVKIGEYLESIPS